MELELRSCDALGDDKTRGDQEVENAFEEFMVNKKHPNPQEDKHAKLHQKSTVDIYTRIVRNFILPTFHKVYEPFHSPWLFDSTTP